MKQENKYLLNFLVNSLLVLSGIATSISGFVLQLGFHVGNANRHLAQKENPQSSSIEEFLEVKPGNTVFGGYYTTWSAIHKFAIVLLLLLMLYHLAIHWKWYKGVLAKHLVSKNKQVIILSVLFLLAALTGLIPWFIDLSGSKNLLRLLLIEIHDKISILLTIYLVLHVARRVKWFYNAFEKLKK